MALDLTKSFAEGGDLLGYIDTRNVACHPDECHAITSTRVGITRTRPVGEESPDADQARCCWACGVPLSHDPVEVDGEALHGLNGNKVGHWELTD